MQTMQRIASDRDSNFHAESGVDSIVHKSTIEPIFTGALELLPASVTATPQLARLFPLQSYEDFIWERLAPKLRNSGSLRPESFRMMLGLLKVYVRKIAMRRQIASKRYGRLAQLLDDQDDLAKLAQMYFGSLLRG